MAAAAAVTGSLLLTSAASLLALFVTWFFLLGITVLGTRQSRKTGGGEVTLFTVARHRNAGRLMTTNTARDAAATAARHRAGRAPAAGRACCCRT